LCTRHGIIIIEREQTIRPTLHGGTAHQANHPNGTTISGYSSAGSSWEEIFLLVHHLKKKAVSLNKVAHPSITIDSITTSSNVNR
jgi:hypothetical protein